MRNKVWQLSALLMALSFSFTLQAQIFGGGNGGDDSSSGGGKGGGSTPPQTPVFESIFKEMSVIPPSPNATAFNQFIDQPVGHYTGVPSITVPIYTISMPQLSLPISLNYHAGGLKVGERSSWVGAGWSLNAGGSINRTVRGLPDEYIGQGFPGPENGTSLPGLGRQRFGFLRVANSYFHADQSGIDLNEAGDCQVFGPGIDDPQSPLGPASDVDYFARG
ncbi:MAG: hypothetical protein AAFO69_07325, partial [Bacteroidota bacterium]